MFERILVICTGNICRSPLAAALLTRGLVEKGTASVQSAGVAALTGHAAEETVSRIAAEHGISLADHCATQISIDATRQAELILAMEQRHIDAVLAFDPTARGKTFCSATGHRVKSPTPTVRKRPPIVTPTLRSPKQPANGSPACSATVCHRTPLPCPKPTHRKSHPFVIPAKAGIQNPRPPFAAHAEPGTLRPLLHHAPHWVPAFAGTTAWGHRSSPVAPHTSSFRRRPESRTTPTFAAHADPGTASAASSRAARTARRYDGVGHR